MPAPPRSKHRGRTYFTAAVLAGVTGAVVAATAGSASGDHQPGRGATVRPVNTVESAHEQGAVPVSVFHGGSRP